MNGKSPFRAGYKLVVFDSGTKRGRLPNNLVLHFSRFVPPFCPIIACNSLKFHLKKNSYFKMLFHFSIRIIPSIEEIRK